MTQTLPRLYPHQLLERKCTHMGDSYAGTVWVRVKHVGLFSDAMHSPAGIYLLKVNKCDIRSKLTIKTPLASFWCLNC